MVQRLHLLLSIQRLLSNRQPTPLKGVAIRRHIIGKAAIQKDRGGFAGTTGELQEEMAPD